MLAAPHPLTHPLSTAKQVWAAMDAAVRAIRAQEAALGLPWRHIIAVQVTPPRSSPPPSSRMQCTRLPAWPRPAPLTAACTP